MRGPARPGSGRASGKPARRAANPARRPRVAGRSRSEPDAPAAPAVTVPSPTPRAATERRDEEPQPEQAATTAEERAAEPSPREPDRGARRQRIVRRLLVAVIVLGFGFGIGAGVWTYLLRTTGSAANGALVDAGRTQRLTSQVSDAVSRAFSYNYADTASTRQAAQQVLTGDAVHQYRSLFGKVSQRAGKDKLVLQTSVRAIGVKDLDGDTAHMLVVVDQQKLQGTDGKHSSSTTGMNVTATRSGGAWKIASIHFR